MPESEWTPGPAQIPRNYGKYEYELDTCPGAVTRTPAVAEGSLAYAVTTSGQLEQYFPNLENGVLEAAMVATQAFNELQAVKLENRKGGQR